MTANSNIGPELCLINITGEDKVGLISEVTAYLFDIGADLRDTTFAVLGTGFEFGCVAALDAGHALNDIEFALCGLPTLTGADVTVKPFSHSDDHTEAGLASHMVLVEGGDRPGLIAHLSEVFGTYGANIVRMTSRRMERDADRGGVEYDYRTRFSVHMPPEREDACCAAVSNTAGQLGLSYSCRRINS